jgi:CheY-like chemotaxis protein
MAARLMRMPGQETPSDKPSARVLVVEDDQHIRELVALHLRLEGFDVI